MRTRVPQRHHQLIRISHVVSTNGSTLFKGGPPKKTHNIMGEQGPFSHHTIPSRIDIRLNVPLIEFPKELLVDNPGMQMNTILSIRLAH